MEEIIVNLFAARDLAHKLHLSCKSFSAHLALQDLYEKLLDTADQLAEAYQGKYSIMDLAVKSEMWPVESTLNFPPVEFVSSLATWAEDIKATFHEEDSHLLNIWEELVASIYKVKYKLENLI